MANVTGGSLTPIYNRLNGVDRSHPFEANVFADPSTEAGDVVTITRDDTSYVSPIDTMSYTWRKGITATVRKGGDEKMPTISKMSSRKFRGGSGSLRNQYYWGMTIVDQYHQLQSGIELTGSTASLYVQSLYNQMKAGLDLTSSSAALYVNGLYNQMKAGLALTSSSAAVYVRDLYNQMQSGLALTSSSFVVYAGSADNAARIVGEINANGSTLCVDADHIKMTGQTITLNSIMAISSSMLVLKYPVIVFGNTQGQTASFNSGEFRANSYQWHSGNNTKTVGYSDLTSMIKSVSVANNTLTLTKWDNSNVNFSKATTLTYDTWSSGHTVYRAQQTNYNTSTGQNETTDAATKNLYLVESTSKENSDGSAYTSGNIWYVPIHYKESSNAQTSSPTGLRVYVNCSGIVSDAVNAVTADLNIYQYENNHAVVVVKAEPSNGGTPDHEYLYISQDGGTMYVTKNNWHGYGNYENVGCESISNYHPTAHNYCADDLTRLNSANDGAMALYDNNGNAVAGGRKYYWYYRSSSMNVTTYYS